MSEYTAHPALSPTLGRSNVTMLGIEFGHRRQAATAAGDTITAEVWQEATELLMMMWRSAVIATDAANRDIAAIPLDDEPTPAERVRAEIETLFTVATANNDPERMDTLTEVLDVFTAEGIGKAGR